MAVSFRMRTLEPDIETVDSEVPGGLPAKVEAREKLSRFLSYASCGE